MDYPPAAIINFIDFDLERETDVVARTDQFCTACREHASVSKHVCEFSIAKVLIACMTEPSRHRIALRFSETA